MERLSQTLDSSTAVLDENVNEDHRTRVNKVQQKSHQG